MRTIEISTDVFSSIWKSRMPGEETEDAILRRLLIGDFSPNTATRAPSSTDKSERVLWRDDVRQALEQLGGSAHLEAIYKKVRDIRIKACRRVPRSVDAIVRRELEYNSSDSESYTGRLDWFRSVNGIGAGVWALRSSE